MRIKAIINSTEFKLFLTIWIVYAVYVTPAGGVTPNRYVDLVHSIVNEGRFTIDTYHENTIDKSYYNGHYYAGALPGPAFLAVPAYVVFKGVYALVPQSIKNSASGVQSYKKDKQPNSSFYGSVDNVEFFLSQVFLNLTVLAPFSALGGLLLFKTIRRLGYDAGIALTVTILYAFGSIVFFYSTVFFEQVFSATLGIAAFYLVLGTIQSSGNEYRSSLVFSAGLLAGCGLLVEYTTIFIGGWLGLWLLLTVHRRQIIFFAMGFLIPIAVLMAYDYVLFGNPLDTPYAHLIQVHESVHGIGFFGATYPRLERFLGLLVGPERGLFLFMPITMVGLLGVAWSIWKRRLQALPALICAGIFGFYLLFFSSFTNWRGGSAFGPRYFIAPLPFLFIGVAFAFDFFPRVLIYILGAFSILINWAGAQFGFAGSPLEHIRNVVAQGPTLPIFGAILTHSTSHESGTYLFAARYHSAITIVITIVLVAIASWAFRRAYGRKNKEVYLGQEA